MLITEMNKLILSSESLPMNSKYKDYVGLADEIKECIDLCNGYFNPNHFNLTRSSNEFYDANPVMSSIIKDVYGDRAKLIRDEVFYSLLCGTYIDGIPSELTALLDLTRREAITPNRMVASLDKLRFNKYMTECYNEDPTYIKKVIDQLWGYNVNLLTDVRRMVVNNDIVEIFIENINDVLLCNKNIHSVLSNVDEIENLSYNNNGVVCDGDIPLRTLINRFGIVENDLDLRKVYFVE